MDIHWEQAFDEIVEHLQALVRLDTTNPPGQERPAAEYLAQVLRREGLEPLILESAPGRANLVVHLRGTGQERPLLLLSHLDVVPAEPDKWRYPPFSATVSEGYIWGRGTMDAKNLTAIELMTLLLLKRQGLPLKRDIVMVACADEEEGSRYGLRWLIENHADLLEAAFAINEGGGYGFDLRGQPYFTCQTAEKGICWLRMDASGLSGQAAVPIEENAVVILAEAISRLGRTALPLHLTPTAERFIEGLARGQGAETAILVRGLLDPAASSFLLRQLPLSPTWLRLLHGMLHNTVTPTVLQAGREIQIIPSRATARLDGRLLPGQHPEQFLREVTDIVGPAIDVQVEEYVPPLESDLDSPLYRTIEAVIAEVEPQSILLPMMLCGSTDAKYLDVLNISSYGFCPMRDEGPVSPMQLAHAHNERITLDNLRFGLEVLYRVVRRFCAAP
ncbi:MAG: M20/M25/M40 family metallo-hydrolase [Chloroflexia bacterium]|nr:M20/M25/M40 family metallo-hydrolase [Chloroflexia bacterium]